jgi:tetratricopeptide (TPR) repeat protein
MRRRLIESSCFGVLSLIPLWGLQNLNWLQLCHFIVIFSCLLFLSAKFLILQRGELQKANKISFWSFYSIYQLIIFLYFNFLIFRFFPIRSPVLEGILILSLSLSLFHFLADKGFKLRVIKNSFSQYDLYFFAFFGGILAILILDALIKKEPIFQQSRYFIWLLSFLTYSNIRTSELTSPFAPFRWRLGLVSWAFLWALIAITIGGVEVFSTLYHRAQANKALVEMDYSRSADLFLELEDGNWLEIPLGDKSQYLQLAHALLDEPGNTNNAATLLQIILQQTDSDPPSPIDRGIFQEYLRIGKNYIGLGRYEEAIQVFDKSFSMTSDPEEILTYLREQFSDEIINAIWQGEPFISLQGFEKVKEIQLGPWAISEGVVRKIKKHHLDQALAHSGKQSEHLSIEYASEGPKNLASPYDYWSMIVDIPKPTIPMGIRAFVKGPPGQSSHVCLVLNLVLPNSSSTRWSKKMTVNEDWSVLEIRDLHRLGPEIEGINHVGINTFCEDVSINIDDIQLFTY